MDLTLCFFFRGRGGNRQQWAALLWCSQPAHCVSVLFQFHCCSAVWDAPISSGVGVTVEDNVLLKMLCSSPLESGICNFFSNKFFLKDDKIVPTLQIRIFSWHFLILGPKKGIQQHFFIGVKLIYNVVLVFALQQSEPVINTHVSILIQILFPYRSFQSTE